MCIKKTLLVSLITSSLCLGDNITLLDACKLGATNEPSLKSYELQVKSLDEDIEQARSKFLPQIDATATYLDRKGLLNYSESYEAEKVNSYSVNLRQAIYHPENYAALNKAKYKYSAELLGLENFRQELFAKISEAYLNVLRLQNKVNLSKFYIDSAESSFKQIERMYNLELADKMKYLQSKVDFENSKINHQTQLNQLNLAIANFQMLAATQYLPTNLQINTFDEKSFEVVSSLENNLKVMRLTEYAKSVNSDVDYAKYQHYPKIDLSASYTKFDPDNKTVTDYINDRTVRVELRLPIYTGGAMTSYQRKSELLYRATTYDIADVKRTEKIAFEETKAKYNSAKSNIGLYKDAIESSKLYLHSIQQGYDKGLKSLVELEDAKTKLEETTYKQNDNLYEFILNYIQLLKFGGDLKEENLNKINSFFSAKN